MYKYAVASAVEIGRVLKKYNICVYFFCVNLILKSIRFGQVTRKILINWKQIGIDESCFETTLSGQESGRFYDYGFDYCPNTSRSGVATKSRPGEWSLFGQPFPSPDKQVKFNPRNCYFTLYLIPVPVVLYFTYFCRLPIVFLKIVQFLKSTQSEGYTWKYCVSIVKI